jgi:hypothetical protein
MKKIVFVLFLGSIMQSFAGNIDINVDEPISRLEYLKAFEEIISGYLGRLERYISETTEHAVNDSLTSEISHEYFSDSISRAYIAYASKYMFSIIMDEYSAQKWFAQDVVKGEMYSLFYEHFLPFAIPESKMEKISTLENFLIDKYASKAGYKGVLFNAFRENVSAYLSLMRQKTIFTNVLEKIKLEISSNAGVWSRILRFLGF